jgi:2-oxoglutarate ferredoxin oxidoreductase subunit gamma
MPEGDWRVVRVPLARLAREKLGKAVVANIIALGLIVRLSKVVTEEAAEQAILARVPRGTEELNRQAYRLGLESAEEVAVTSSS